MWAFLGVTHSGEKAKSGAQRLGIYEETQPPPSEKISCGHIPLSLGANMRGDGPFWVPTTKQLH